MRVNSFVAILVVAASGFIGAEGKDYARNWISMHELGLCHKLPLGVDTHAQYQFIKDYEYRERDVSPAVRHCAGGRAYIEFIGKKRI